MDAYADSEPDVMVMQIPFAVLSSLFLAVFAASQSGGADEYRMRLGEVGYPVEVEAETESGKKLRLRAARDRENHVLEFATAEELVAVTVDPTGIYPDLDLTNNRWPR